MTMECIECGLKEGEHESLCGKCYARYYATITVPEYVDLIICPHCGALKKKEHWLNMDDVEEAVEAGVRGAPEFGSKVESADVDIEVTEDNPAVFRVLFKASLLLDGVVARREAESIARVSPLVCDVCSRRHGGYYESIVQIRGQANLSKERLENLSDTVLSLMDSIGSSNRQVFLAKYEARHGGLDFYISTIDAGKHLAREMSRKTGAHLKESGKLVGRKDGRDLYRITYSVRLPPFVEDDYIELWGEVYRIVKVRKDRVDMVLLRTGEYVKRKRDFDDSAKVIGGQELVSEAVVVFEDEKELQILDPETYKTVQVRKPEHYESDENVAVIRHEGQLYIA